jgi:hypothetical protein
MITTFREYLADALRSGSGTSIGLAASLVTPEGAENPSKGILGNSMVVPFEKQLV